MARSEAQLLRDARTAYERGRWISACRVLLAIVPVVFAAHLITGETRPSAIGALLAVVCVLFAQRGGTFGRAVWPGLSGGLAAALLALAFCRLGVCEPDQSSMCGALCSSAGLLAGVLIAQRAVRLDNNRFGFFLPAAIIAAIAGAMGCAFFGLSGLLGLSAGIAVCAAPLVLRRAN